MTEHHFYNLAPQEKLPYHIFGGPPKDKRAETYFDNHLYVRGLFLITRRNYVPAYRDLQDGKGYCGLRALALMKYGLYSGVLFGYTLNVQLNGVEVLQFKSHFYNMLRLSAPLMMISGTYGFTSSFACVMREKNDVWNHAIGGAMTGFVYGTYMRRFTVVFHMGIIFAFSGAIYKYCSDRKIRPFFFFDHKVQHENGWTAGDDDFNAITFPNDSLIDMYDKAIVSLKPYTI